MRPTRRMPIRAAGIIAALALAAGCTSEPSASPDGPPPERPSATPTTSAPFEPRRLTVVMSGDVLLHSGLWASAERDADATGKRPMDFRPLLGSMRPVVRGADLAVCHLETPLAPRHGPYSSYPIFSAPPYIAPALRWAGYDICTTASNHSLDQGYDGLRRTQRLLEQARLEHTGTATSRREARRPLVVEANGVRVGLVSATYGTNGIPIPDDAPWSVPLIRVPDILREARLARRLGADVVLVALHWGLEYQHEPSEDQVAVARRVLASPAVDLVYGHHAHVVQPFDKVRGKWVAYGLGNAIAQQVTTIPGLYDGVTARFTFTERRDGRFRVTRAEYIPTYVTSPTSADPRMRWLNIAAALGGSRPATVDVAELRDALARIRANVNLEQALRHGLRRGR